jgi:UDP-N-acetylmuramate dehydrogenase
LIQDAGLKGVRRGRVEVSNVHANFFVNLGGATASEVMQLVTQVQDRVRERHGVVLELEVQLVGQWDAPLETVNQA